MQHSFIKLSGKGARRRGFTGQRPGLPGESAFAWKNWNNASLALNGLSVIATPSYGTPAAGGWTLAQGIGQFYSNTGDMSLRGFLRGGSWGDGGIAGVSTLNLLASPSYVNASVGFRVSR